MVTTENLLFPLFFTFIFFSLPSLSISASNDTAKCEAEVNNLMPCLPYTQKSDPSPTKECCTKLTDVEERSVLCLCYLLRLIVNGDRTVKSLNLDLTRTLQLPTVCKINANVTQCPKILNISPSSPEYAIFMNQSSGNSTSGTRNPQNQDSSAFMAQVNSMGRVVMALIVAAMFSVFLDL
ncbi:non-specific lipid transfer protein GPI-anchored 1 [Amborella trichopoda]|uniref:Bifunctional inhibitor/plant lipid transfer protein/seed storage helical domain-containing protein n=1 Tax=Amborella trichopoda TaxID=13333 RepID=W1PP42_AMBTC|nr:non-specific lipid transfer protein GPI-anchored 1 [Amborella trichopoda]ERN09828.1 hypothetical protein AMTR_s00013p00038620 [Amborella trichopoda]|eukprot:XP_006848247.1 non-specific lipid transfer protein GPI-anchored 1 [Amborella trichopoda]